MCWVVGLKRLQRLAGLWLKKNGAKMHFEEALKRLKSIPITVDWAVVESYQPRVPTQCASNLGQDRVDWYVAKLVSEGQLPLPRQDFFEVRVVGSPICALASLCR